MNYERVSPWVLVLACTVASSGCKKSEAATESTVYAASDSEVWLTAEQVKTLDAASDVTPAYPYWHQRGFGERNPPPV